MIYVRWRGTCIGQEKHHLDPAMPGLSLKNINQVLAHRELGFSWKTPHTILVGLCIYGLLGNHSYTRMVLAVTTQGGCEQTEMGPHRALLGCCLCYVLQFPSSVPGHPRVTALCCLWNHIWLIITNQILIINCISAINKYNKYDDE